MSSEMRLWLVERNDEEDWDEACAFVVRAQSPKAARRYAAARCGDEGSALWLDPTRSTCKQLTYDGEPGVVLRDFTNG